MKPAIEAHAYWQLLIDSFKAMAADEKASAKEKFLKTAYEN